MGATIHYYLAGGGRSPAPDALPLGYADLGGRLVLVAAATLARKIIFPVDYQAKQIAVAVVHATRTIPWEDECEEEGEPVDCCHMGAGEKMLANSSAHSPGLDSTQKAAGTVAHCHRRILSDLHTAAEEAADVADFLPKDAACYSCRSSDFCAPHP